MWLSEGLPRRWWLPGLILTALVAITLWPRPKQVAATVTLLYFRAEWRADVGTVVITWGTASEIGLAGFQLERSASPSGGFAPINGGEVYPAEGDQLTGADYGPFVDDDPPPIGITYWYRLVLINLDNSRYFGPPVAVLIGTESTVTPTPTSPPPSHWVYLPIVIRQ